MESGTRWTKYWAREVRHTMRQGAGRGRGPWCWCWPATHPAKAVCHCWRCGGRAGSWARVPLQIRTCRLSSTLFASVIYYPRVLSTPHHATPGSARQPAARRPPAHGTPAQAQGKPSEPREAPALEESFVIRKSRRVGSGSATLRDAQPAAGPVSLPVVLVLWWWPSACLRPLAVRAPAPLARWECGQRCGLRALTYPGAYVI
jgi:hypothetical protein